MNDNDLRALLYDALGELRVLASYLEDDYPWPNAGLRMTAKAHDRMVKRIEAALEAAGRRGEDEEHEVQVQKS